MSPEPRRQVRVPESMLLCVGEGIYSKGHRAAAEAGLQGRSVHSRSNGPDVNWRRIASTPFKKDFLLSGHACRPVCAFHAGFCEAHLLCETVLSLHELISIGFVSGSAFLCRSCGWSHLTVLIGTSAVLRVVGQFLTKNCALLLPSGLQAVPVQGQNHEKDTSSTVKLRPYI